VRLRQAREVSGMMLAWEKTPTATKRQKKGRKAMDHPVTIKGMKYDPAVLTIKKGDTVTWTNQDGMTHTATAPFPVKKPFKWNTDDIKKDKSKSITFNDASWQGTYGCIYHGNMKGEIKIE
jgi:plastocyanin